MKAIVFGAFVLFFFSFCCWITALGVCVFYFVLVMQRMWMSGPAFFFSVSSPGLLGGVCVWVHTYACVCLRVYTCVHVCTFRAVSSSRTGCVRCVTWRNGSTLVPVHRDTKDVAPEVPALLRQFSRWAPPLFSGLGRSVLLLAFWDALPTAEKQHFWQISSRSNLF